MAGDAIKYTDLVESNALPKIITEFEGITVAIEQTNKELIKTASLMKGALNTPATNAQQAAEIQRLADEVDKLNKKLTENKAIGKAISVETQKARIIVAETNKTTKELAKSELGLTSEYQKQTKLLAELTKQCKDLLITKKVLSEEDKILIKQQQELDTKIKTVDATMGQHQRNVGNYAGAFQKLYSGIKTVANILPGLGISGVIMLGWEAMVAVIDYFNEKIEGSAEGIKHFNKFMNEGHKIYESQREELDKILIDIGVLTGKYTEFEGQKQNILNESYKTQKENKIAFDTEMAQISADYDKKIIDAKIHHEKVVDKFTLKTLSEEFYEETKKSLKLEEERANAIAQAKHKRMTLDANANVIAFEKVHKAEIEYKIKKDKEDAKAGKEKNKEEDDAWKIYLKNWEAKYKELLQLQKQSEKDLIDSEKKKWKKENEIGEDRTKLIIDNMRLEASLTQSKIDDENADYEERKNNFKAQYDEFGNISEESKKHMELLEKQHNQNLLHIQYDEETADDKTKKEKVKKENDHLKEMYKIVSDYQKKISDLKEKAIENDLKRNQSSIEVQTALAAAGLNNTLDYELKKQDELEKARAENLEKQKQDAKRREQIELGIAFYSAYAKAMEKPDETIPQALAEAATGVFAAKAFGAALASYFVGTEDTGDGSNIDNKGGFLSILHPHERVINAEDNKQLLDAGLTNKDVVRNAMMFEQLTLSDVSHSKQADNAINSMLLNKVDKLINVIRDKPEHHIELSRTGDVIKTTVEKEYRKQTTIKTHLS